MDKLHHSSVILIYFFSFPFTKDSPVLLLKEVIQKVLEQPFLEFEHLQKLPGYYAKVTEHKQERSESKVLLKGNDLV